MRILICGDRNWVNKDLIEETVKNEIRKLGKIDAIIEGEAKGADSLGREGAEKLSIPVLKFPANWNKYGKGAGYIRNQQMLDEGKPNLVLAFHNDIQNSKGTKDMMARARENNIDVILIKELINAKGLE